MRTENSNYRKTVTDKFFKLGTRYAQKRAITPTLRNNFFKKFSREITRKFALERIKLKITYNELIKEIFSMLLKIRCFKHEYHHRKISRSTNYSKMKIFHTQWIPDKKYKTVNGVKCFDAIPTNSKNSKTLKLFGFRLRQSEYLKKEEYQTSLCLHPFVIREEVSELPFLSRNKSC